MPHSCIHVYYDTNQDFSKSAHRFWALLTGQAAGWPMPWPQHPRLFWHCGRCREVVEDLLSVGVDVVVAIGGRSSRGRRKVVEVVAVVAVAVVAVAVVAVAVAVGVIEPVAVVVDVPAAVAGPTHILAVHIIWIHDIYIYIIDIFIICLHEKKILYCPRVICFYSTVLRKKIEFPKSGHPFYREKNCPAIFFCFAPLLL